MFGESMLRVAMVAGVKNKNPVGLFLAVSFGVYTPMYQQVNH